MQISSGKASHERNPPRHGERINIKLAFEELAQLYKVLQLARTAAISAALQHWIQERDYPFALWAAKGSSGHQNAAEESPAKVAGEAKSS